MIKSFPGWVLILCSILPFYPVVSQDSIVSAKDTLEQVSQEPFKLEEINKEIEKAEKTFSRMEYKLKADESSVKIIEGEFREFNLIIQREVDEITKNRSAHYSKFVLDNTYFIWKDFDMKLLNWQDKVNFKIKINQDFMEELDLLEERWVLTLNDEAFLNKPENFKLRIYSVIKKAGELRVKFQEKQSVLISLENEIAARTSLCTLVVERVLQLQENLRDSLFIATSLPLPLTPISPDQFSPLGDKFRLFWHFTTKTIKIYYHSESKFPILLLLLICILIIYSVKYGLLKLKINSELIKKQEIQTILFDFPLLTIFALFFLHYRLFFPYHPLLLGKLIILFLLIGSRYFLPGFNEPQMRRFMSMLVLLLILNYLQMVFWYFGNVIRFYVFLEQVTGLVLTYQFVKPSFWKNMPVDFKLIRAGGLLAVFIFAFFLISLFANVFGYFDLSIMMLKIGLHVPAFTVIFYGVYKIWIAITSALLLIGKATKQSYLTHYWEKIEKRALQVVAFILILMWIYFVTVLFEISNPIGLWINEFLITKRTVGTLELTIGAILTCILI
jgi:hypothetical protein